MVKDRLTHYIAALALAIHLPIYLPIYFICRELAKLWPMDRRGVLATSSSPLWWHGFHRRWLLLRGVHC